MAIDSNPAGLMVDGRLIPDGVDLRSTLYELLTSREFQRNLEAGWRRFLGGEADGVADLAVRRLLGRNADRDELALLRRVAEAYGYRAFVAVLLHSSEYEDRYGRGLPTGGTPVQEELSAARCRTGADARAVRSSEPMTAFPLSRFRLLALLMTCACLASGAAKTASAPAQSPTRTVTTAAELVALLDSPYQGVIFIPGGTRINMAGHQDTRIGSGVTLRSDRGGTRRGALIYTTDFDRKYALFVVEGSERPDRRPEDQGAVRRARTSPTA